MLVCVPDLLNLNADAGRGGGGGVEYVHPTFIRENNRKGKFVTKKFA